MPPVRDVGCLLPGRMPDKRSCPHISKRDTRIGSRRICHQIPIDYGQREELRSVSRTAFRWIFEGSGRGPFLRRAAFVARRAAVAGTVCGFMGTGLSPLIERGRGILLVTSARMTSARPTAPRAAERGVESCDTGMRAFQRHSVIVSELRQSGWTLVAYTAGRDRTPFRTRHQHPSVGVSAFSLLFSQPRTERAS